MRRSEFGSFAVSRATSFALSVGEAGRVEDSVLSSWESLGRFDVVSDVDDCRRFVGGDLRASGSGRITAEAMGLQDISAQASNMDVITYPLPSAIAITPSVPESG